MPEPHQPPPQPSPAPRPFLETRPYPISADATCRCFARYCSENSFVAGDGRMQESGVANELDNVVAFVSVVRINDS